MKGLGRGLDALLAKDEEAGAGDALKTVKLEELQPGKYQPRTRMDQASLEELARSLKAQGVMHARARLILARLQFFQLERLERVAGAGVLLLGQQRVQPASQSFHFRFLV